VSPFTLAVVGDRRLGVAHFRFLRVHLDRLLVDRLPRVRVLSGGGQGIDILAERWAEENGLHVDRHLGGRDYRTEGLFGEWLLSSQLDGLVVIDGGGNSEADIARRARERGISVRVVDARAILIGKR
jgi:hypothetical protein